jgi:hypothetical protein
MPEAANINSYDEVPNNAWFTNRQGMYRLSPEVMRRGALTGTGPDTSGPWIVSRPKVQGLTPGFWIKDPKGDLYIIKFDPIGFPDLATASAIVAGRYFHAAGYNVPEEYIVYWRPEQLEIKEGLMFTDVHGVHRLMTQADLDAMLSRVERQPDGSIRSLASKLLPNVRGPFSFSGRRKADPNDWCPHTLRRDLRGLRVIASLVNHWDIKDQNTMDVLAEEDGRQYLKHYLIDFGSVLGSAGNRPQETIHGYANVADPRDIGVSLTTLGLKSWGWEDAKPWTNPSVGYFESEIFHPAKWDPIYPLPPFENMTDRDAYWGAKIVMAFRDDDLRALIEAGEYSDPEAVEMIFEILKVRREKIGRHWFRKVSPVDYFQLEQHGDSLLVHFQDLEIKYDLASSAEYQYTIYLPKGKVKRETTQAHLELLPAETNRLATPESDQLLRVDVRVRRQDEKWRRETKVWLWYHHADNRFQLVGVEH